MRRDEIPAGAKVFIGWAHGEHLVEQDVKEQPRRCHEYTENRKGEYSRCGNSGLYEGFCDHHRRGPGVPPAEGRSEP